MPSAYSPSFMVDLFIRQGDLAVLRLTTPTIGSVQLGDPHTARGHIGAGAMSVLSQRQAQSTVRLSRHGSMLSLNSLR